MIDFSDGLAHLYLRGLNEISTNSKKGINSWLQEGRDYAIYSDQSNDEFVISVFDLESFLEPYAYDINRLTCASIESLYDIKSNTSSPKFLGWDITKYYYSAFFSAHSILRITGNSLSNIELRSIEKVRMITRARGCGFNNINTGIYSIDVNRTHNSVRFFKETEYNDSHKGLWYRFLIFLTTIKSSIYTHLTFNDAQIIEKKIDELIEAMKNWNTPRGSWLSTIRNRVNYSQDYGVWFPYKNFDGDLLDVAKYQGFHNQNPLTIDLKNYRGKDLIYFIRTCQLINAINFNLQADLKNKNSRNKSFLLHGLFEYKSRNSF